MAKARAAPTVSSTFLQDLVGHYLELSERLDAQLRVALEVSPGKAVQTPSGTARLVESDVVTYDLETLRAQLSPEVLELVTRRQVDKDRVEAAAALRTIPAEVLDRARRITKRRPQLRVRR